MSKRIRLLVSLAKENFEKNISPNVLSQDHELLPGNKKKLFKIKAITSSPSSSTSNSSSSSGDSSNSNSYDEIVDVSQNPTISGVHKQEPEEKKRKEES